MSWRTPGRGLKSSLSPSWAEEPTTQAELYVLKVPVDSEQPAGVGGRPRRPAAKAASRIIAMLQSWFYSSLGAPRCTSTTRAAQDPGCHRADLRTRPGPAAPAGSFAPARPAFIPACRPFFPACRPFFPASRTRLTSSPCPLNSWPHRGLSRVPARHEHGQPGFKLIFGQFFAACHADPCHEDPGQTSMG
jgi:hypothetical protein